MFNILSYIVGRQSTQMEYMPVIEKIFKFISVLKLIEKGHGDGLVEGYLDLLHQVRTQSDDPMSESEFHKLFNLNRLDEGQQAILQRQMGSKFMREEQIIKRLEDNTFLATKDVRAIRRDID